MGIDFFGPIQSGQPFPTGAPRQNALIGAVQKLRHPANRPSGGPNNGGFKWQGVTITVVNSRTDPIKQGQAVLIKRASIANTDKLWRETPFQTIAASTDTIGNSGTWGIAVQEIPGTSGSTKFAGQVLMSGFVTTKVTKMPGNDRLVDLGAFRGKTGADAEKLHTSAAGCATLIDFSGTTTGTEYPAIVYVHGCRMVSPSCKVELLADLTRSSSGSGQLASVLKHNYTVVSGAYRANGYDAADIEYGTIYVYGDEIPSGKKAVSGTRGWAQADPWSGDWILTKVNGCLADV